MIPVSSATKLKFSYVNRAHYGVMGSQNRVYDELLAALAMNDLEPEKNEQITALTDQFLDNSNTAIDRMVRLDRKSAGSSRFDWFDREEPSEDQLKLNDLRDGQDEYHKQVRAELKLVLGDRWEDYQESKVKFFNRNAEQLAVAEGPIVTEEGFVVVDSAEAETAPTASSHNHDTVEMTVVGPTENSGGVEVESGTDGYQGVDSPRNERGSGGAPSISDIAAILPQPNSREDVGRLINNLDLNEVQRELIQGLYADYRDEFNNYRNTEVMPFAGRMIGIGIGLQGGVVPSEEELRRLFKDGRQAFDGMVLVDQTFFDNVATVLGVESTYFPLRQARLRRGVSLYLPEKLSDGLRTNGMGFGGSAEFTVNLADVLTELELSKDERSRLEVPLLAYHEEMGLTTTSAWNSLLDSIIELLVLARRVYVENIGSMDQEPDPMMMASVFFENQDELGRLLDSGIAALKSMSEVNIRHVDEIARLLPPEQQERFVDLYKRTAFPHIYERPYYTVATTMERAQALTTMTPQQLSELGVLIAEYNSAELDICEELVELNREGSPMPLGGILGATGSNDGIQGFMVYEQKRQQLVFDRTNLEQRTTDSLKEILNDAQRQQLSLSQND